MITRPRLRHHLHAEVVGDRVLLLGESGHIALRGRAYAGVVPLLDGRRTAEEIVDTLLPEIPPVELYRALMLLERHDHIEDAEPGAPLAADALAFWSASGVRAGDAVGRLARARVAVVAFGTVPHTDLAAELDRLGVRVVSADPWGTANPWGTAEPADPSSPAGAADLVVALTDDYLRPGIDALNRRALAEGTPWLLAKPNGGFPWIGPLFRPGYTGCWECLAQRLRANREVEEFARESTGGSRVYPALGALPSTLGTVLGMVASAVAAWSVLDAPSPLQGVVISYDAVRLRTEEHVLVRRPACTECGEPVAVDPTPRPLLLDGAGAPSTLDGGFRTVPPEETLRRFGHHLSPITGVVRGLTRVGDDGGSPVHVYVCGQNLAMRQDSFGRLRRNLRSNSCGKGMTDAQARASGLGEALERYSGVFRGDEPRRHASFEELGAAAVDPRHCMLFSAAQYRDRAGWAGRHGFDAVPAPFEPAARLDWTPLWSLTREEPRYLPTSYCYYSYPGGGGYCHADSNGCAAGNTVAEAVLQGGMELVERDSTAVWWYNRLRRPAVDLDSFDDPFIERMRAHYAAIGRQLWVLDLTGDLGIPAMVAVSRRVDGPPEDIIFAPAAHLDARVAVLRALTELNQMIPGVRHTAGPGTYAYDDVHAVRWWRTATLANQPYLSPASDLPPMRYSDYPARDGADIDAGIALLSSALREAGLDLLVLDQTRSDVGLPVVRVVVPGLRHFWPRYAPGRLYDVPVRLGWLSTPLDESQLNPIAVFI